MVSSSVVVYISRILYKRGPRFLAKPYTSIAMPGYSNYDESIHLKLESLNLTLPFEYEGKRMRQGNE